MPDKKKKDPLDSAISTIKKQVESPAEGAQMGVGKKLTELFQYLSEKFPDAFSQTPQTPPADGGQMSPADKLFGGS